MREFEKIYHEHYKTLYRIAMKMLSDDAAARDVLQDVYMSFFEIMKKGKEILKPKGYLIRATLNKCIDHSSRASRFEKINGKPPSSVEQNDERNDDREIVRMALSAMNEENRKLLVLYSEGYSYKEIADIAEMKFSSVGKTLARALNKMKEEIKKLEYELS